jgi:hypothetical protein
MVELWRSLQPHFKAAWEQAKPYFMSLGKLQRSCKTNILCLAVFLARTLNLGNRWIGNS